MRHYLKKTGRRVLVLGWRAEAPAPFKPDYERVLIPYTETEQRTKRQTNPSNGHIAIVRRSSLERREE